MKIEIVVQQRVTKPAELSGTWTAIVNVYDGFASDRVIALFRHAPEARYQCDAWKTVGLECVCVTVEIPS